MRNDGNTPSLFTDPVVAVPDVTVNNPDIVNPCAIFFGDRRPALKAAAVRAGGLPFKRQCAFIGCFEPATEQHHVYDKAIFGPLAERFDHALHWHCVEHHRLVTQLQSDYWRRWYS